MKLRFVKTLLIGGFVTIQAAPFHAAADAGKSAETKAHVASLVHHAVDGYMQTPQAKGVSIGILRDGVAYTYNFGALEAGKTRVPSSHTMYEIASLTKTFTATLLAEAVVEKRVALDDDVGKYLKGNYPNLEYRGQPIRLADLINHRSGLPFNLPDRPEMMPGYHNLPQAEWMRGVNGILANYTRADFFAALHNVTLQQAPGSHFKYSNAAALLLGYVLGDLYGASYEDLVRRAITKPLGMPDTTIHPRPSQMRRMARGYDDKNNVVPLYSEQLQAAAGLKSTVADMLRYMRWQVAESDAAVRLTHAPRVIDGHYSVGLNWQTFSADGVRTVYQSGTAPGFSSVLAFSPELKIGVVILTNELDPTSPQKLNAMANEILRGLNARAVPL